MGKPIYQILFKNKMEFDKLSNKDTIRTILCNRYGSNLSLSVLKDYYDNGDTEEREGIMDMNTIINKLKDQGLTDEEIINKFKGKNGVQ